MTSSANSKNCAARRIVTGTGPASATSSWRSLPGVVAVARDAVDAEDRQHDVMADARALLGRQQVLRARAEERARRIGLQLVRVRRVDDRLDTLQRLVQPVAGDGVRARRARDDDGIVSGALERADGHASHEACSSCDCDPHPANVPAAARSPVDGPAVAEEPAGRAVGGQVDRPQHARRALLHRRPPAPPTSPSMPSVAARAASRSRALRSVRWPRAASPRATSRPIPRLAPVTIATGCMRQDAVASMSRTRPR